MVGALLSASWREGDPFPGLLKEVVGVDYRRCRLKEGVDYIQLMLIDVFLWYVGNRDKIMLSHGSLLSQTCLLGTVPLLERTA